MSKHVLAISVIANAITAHDYVGTPHEVAVTADGRKVALWLPDHATLWLDIAAADRLAHLLLVAANAAAYEVS